MYAYDVVNPAVSFRLPRLSSKSRPASSLGVRSASILATVWFTRSGWSALLRVKKALSARPARGMVWPVPKQAAGPTRPISDT